VGTVALHLSGAVKRFGDRVVLDGLSLDVAANVRLGGRYRANRDRFNDLRAGELLELFGLADLAGSLPA
jgi:hypothetical protein